MDFTCKYVTFGIICLLRRKTFTPTFENYKLKIKHVCLKIFGFKPTYMHQKAQIYRLKLENDRKNNNEAFSFFYRPFVS